MQGRGGAWTQRKKEERPRFSIARLSVSIVQDAIDASAATHHLLQLLAAQLRWSTYDDLGGIPSGLTSIAWMSDYGDEWSLDEDAFSQLQEIEKTIIPSTRRAAHYLATRAATAHRGSQLSSAVLNSPRVTRSGKRPSQDRPTEVLGLQRQGKQQRIGSSDYGDDVPLDDDTFSQLVEIEKAFPLTTRNAARHSLARAATPHRASHSSPSVLDGPCATPQGQGLGQDHPTQFPGLRQEGGQEDTGSGNIGGPRLDIEYDRSTSALHAWPQTLAEVKGGALNPIVIADILLSDLAEPGTGLNGPIEVAVQDKTEAGASTTKGEAPGSSQQEKEAVQETRSLWERFRQRRGFLSGTSAALAADLVDLDADRCHVMQSAILRPAAGARRKWNMA